MKSIVFSLSAFRSFAQNGSAGGSGWRPLLVVWHSHCHELHVSSFVVLRRCSVYSCVWTQRENRKIQIIFSYFRGVFSPQKKKTEIYCKISHWSKIERSWTELGETNTIGDQRKRGRGTPTFPPTPENKFSFFFFCCTSKGNKSISFFSWSTEWQNENEEKALNWQRERMRGKVRGEGHFSSSSSSSPSFLRLVL